MDYRLQSVRTDDQWPACAVGGPAPCDPRHEEADPFDAAPYLKKGHNVLAVRVLFYGFGEGTWVAGNPGLLYRLQVGDACIYSDASTVCCVDYAHRPGQFQRWFLRALQEDYDARREMPGWQGEAFSPSSAWKPAMVTSECADRPSVYTAYDEYTAGGFSPTDDSGRLYKREIPMPQEVFVPAASLVESGTVTWLTAPDDWFYFRSPGVFETAEDATFCRQGDEMVAFFGKAGHSYYLTYEFSEQLVGFPQFSIAAPEGTIIELIVQESHTPHGPIALLDTGFYCWSRFTCKAGRNDFRCFDFESLKWLQLHITCRLTAKCVSTESGCYGGDILFPGNRF